MAHGVMFKRLLSATVDKPMKHYDFIISGGGLIGSTLACALGKNPLFNGRRILLIEATSKKDWQLGPHYSNRVSSINKSTKSLFERLGVWKYIEQLRYQRVTGIKVWGQYSTNQTNFQHSHDEDMAYIIENDVIINSVLNELRQVKNIDMLYGSKIKNVELPCTQSDTNLAKVYLEDGSVFSGSLLIGADGTNSKIRSVLGVNYISWTYKQMAIVATLRIYPDESTTVAWQKFTPDGTIAILPLTKDLRSLVWSTTAEKAKLLLSLNDEDFVDTLNDTLMEPATNDNFVNLTNDAVNAVLNLFHLTPTTCEIIPPYMSSVEESSRAAFPLGFGHCANYVVNQAVLIGDAAHKVHPLAGQGVNLGFNDVHNLSEALSEGVRQGRPLGHYTDLKRYEAISQAHNLPVMLAIDSLQKLYVNDWQPIKAIANSCFKIAEALPPLKKIMKQFAG